MSFKGGIFIKEYGIYIRHGSGIPYMLDTYKNIESAKLKLYQMVQLEEERQRPYFVDNDFFNNKYIMVGKLKYFCIKERDISEWEDYSEEKAKKDTENKILYFCNYKKV